MSSTPRIEAIADEVGTPFYAYDLDLFRERIRTFERLLADTPHLTCYAVKANDALALLRVVAQEGLGADIVSAGELDKSLRAGIDPTRIVFSGVGKRRDELAAALDAGVRSLNVESLDEVAEVVEQARALGRRAPVSVRLNPDVAAGTHAFLTTGTAASKFGLAEHDALEVLRAAAADPALEPVGVSFHIGSQIIDTTPMSVAAERAAELWRAARAESIELRDLDVGGGLGLAYDGGREADLAAYVDAMCDAAAALGATLVLEPGRYLVGPVGIFVTRVLRVKRVDGRAIAVCDGGSNDFLRPSLYGAAHPIEVRSRVTEIGTVDVVGPLCESGDYLALDQSLPVPEPGDLVVLGLAGAYGRVMSSTYNARPLCAEVMLEGSGWRIGRERGTYEDLVRNERP
ncbi:MAG TPA: diaminopimelate decarboxylase [Gaiellaceae bacterium]|nr:diaminopimelate decarboxylase [Gaiellaceae bacterium]